MTVEEERLSPEEQELTVYIRKGSDNNERWFSFRRSDHMPIRKLLKLGIAVDGNQALFGVTRISDPLGVNPTRYTMPNFEAADEEPEAVNLPSALAQVQMRLVKWLLGCGYKVIRFA